MCILKSKSKYKIYNNILLRLCVLLSNRRSYTICGNQPATIHSNINKYTKWKHEWYDEKNARQKQIKLISHFIWLLSSVNNRNNNYAISKIHNMKDIYEVSTTHFYSQKNRATFYTNVALFIYNFILAENYRNFIRAPYYITIFTSVYKYKL